MKQYCRYCGYCFDGDAPYCTAKDNMRDIFQQPIEPLKTRWKNLIKSTCKRFVMIFKPYFDK